MDGKELAEFKDKILRMIVDKDHGADSEWLFAKLKKEGLTRNHLKKILEQIDNWERDVATLTIGQTHHLERTLITKTFLDRGGFVNQYHSDLEADIEAEKLSERDERMKRLEERKLKTFWVPIAVSIISLGFAAYSLFKPSNNVTKEEFKEMQSEIEGLRNNFKKENDELKDSLYQANMLISIYEGDSLP